MKVSFSRIALAPSLVFGFCLSFSLMVQAEEPEVRFDRDIRPILSDNCFHCHGPDSEHREADLRLDLREDAIKDHDGSIAIKPGDLANSQAWQRIISSDEDEVMPPKESNKHLTKTQKDLIKRWIESGAEYTTHWAFVAPKKAPLPKVKQSDWVKNPIDHFILSELEKKGWQPNSEADRRTLIRRVTLDLTGLPPTPAQVKAFVEDKSPNAYEKLVDRLLADRHYGERMAMAWLDVARYGDTSVYHADGPRYMWAWRDQVVKDYNANLPFDQFSINQIAGDLIPDGTIEQKISSGFNRNNGTTDEGGLIVEEYRVEYAVDRVKTTSTVWLGMSMECGQCHEHKFDPITQKEYYQFYAFFNVSSDSGKQTRNGNAAPIVNIPDVEKEKQLPAHQEKMKAHEELLKNYMAKLDPKVEAWVAEREKDYAEGQSSKLPEDAIHHFDITEGKNKFVSDSVKKDLKGEIKGPVKWVNGQADKGLRFEGKTLVDFGNIADFERDQGFSYGGWVKCDGGNSGAILARMDDGADYRGYDLYLAGDRVSVHIINTWPGNAIKVTTEKPVPKGKWTHIFATYDGSSKAAGVKIYFNGVEQKWKIEQNGLKDTIKSKAEFYIGSRKPGSKLNKVEVDSIQVYDRTLSGDEVTALAGSDPLVDILKVAKDKRTKEHQKKLKDYYLNKVDKEYAKLQKTKNDLKKQEDELKKPITSVMVMGDMGKPRDTFVLNRGMYDAPTKVKVTPDTPSLLPPMNKDFPKNRLGLAKWMFQDDHPLTSRVAVNRLWQMFFGEAIVSTMEDFGGQGEFPSHPELLDWLAVDFRENGWDMKRLIKQMLMSATYRQSSDASQESYARDQDNIYHARGARFRIQGEFLRDNALFVSGLLVDTPGGPGVKPYQPPGLWAEVGLGGNPKFKQDKGEKLYRRSIYTYWKRSAPPPNMLVFDAPTREKCLIARARTNTPLQALVTLNDVQFVEAARNLAQRTMKEAGTSAEKRVDFLYENLVARVPSDDERKVVLDVLQDALKQYQGDVDAANKLLTLGESKREESLDAIEHAAWTIVASMLMNLDETLTRE
jgi:hypothetical protein